MAGLAIACHAVGRNPEADAPVAALIRAYRVEVDEAFAWLDRAYAQKDVGLYLDPRYKTFLPKTKLMNWAYDRRAGV